jgi:integrase
MPFFAAPFFAEVPLSSRADGTAAVDTFTRTESINRRRKRRAPIVCTVTFRRAQKAMAKPHLRIVAPTTENRTVTPRRRTNADLRTREHLTADEVERLIEAAKDNRYGHRDALMVLLTFRHGLRATEICDLRWEQVDFKTATLHVRRVKSGTPATHPLTGREMRALRRHQRESEGSPFGSCRSVARR